MAGWGAGTQILVSTSSWTEYRPFMGSTTTEWRRVVTDVNEIWVGMDYSSAESKRSTLIGTQYYTSAVRTYVGGGQHQVTATKRTTGAWQLAII